MKQGEKKRKIMIFQILRKFISAGFSIVNIAVLVAPAVIQNKNMQNKNYLSSKELLMINEKSLK